MTNEDFAGLFGDDAVELAAAAAAVEAEIAAEKAAEIAAEPAKDGLWFDSNQDNENGHAISIYKLVMGGKVVLWARVNTALTVEVPGLPAGITAHPIEIRDAKSTKTITTKGVGMMAPHNDGTGTHIDGTTVRAYVLPRIPRFLGELYGV